VGTLVDVYYYLEETKFIAPDIRGVFPGTLGTQITNSNFTWGSNTLSGTSTENTNLFGKIATQSPTQGALVYVDPINYGIYVDGRPTVPNVVGQTEATAKTNINNVGLNWSVSYQALTSSSLNYLAGTVASQSPASGTRLASGSTVSIVVYTQYQPQPVTRSATVYFGDDSFNGHMRDGTNYSTPSAEVDWNFTAFYGDVGESVTGYTNGLKEGSQDNYLRLKTFIGTNSSTSGTHPNGHGKHAAVYGWKGKTTVTNWIKSNVTGGAEPTIGTIEFVFSVGSDGANGKTWWLDYLGSNPTTSPSTLTQSGNGMLNSQEITGIDNSSIWDYSSAITVHQGVNSTSTTRFGSINWAYFAMNITWTEFV